jgi:hypothetical protein
MIPKPIRSAPAWLLALPVIELGDRDYGLPILVSLCDDEEYALDDPERWWGAEPQICGGSTYNSYNTDVDILAVGQFGMHSTRPQVDVRPDMSTSLGFGRVVAYIIAHDIPVGLLPFITARWAVGGATEDDALVLADAIRAWTKAVAA